MHPLGSEGFAADEPKRTTVAIALLITGIWMLVALAAVTLCAYARRTDEEIARAELAPVVELDLSAVASRRHSAA
jgi:beta-lactamase regulating signal transducer with metallopeptidase domain